MNATEIGNYGGKFLGSSDFLGGPRAFTIAGWEIVEFKDEQKIALELEDEKRKIILNKTNCRNLINGIGSADLDEWIDKRIRVDVIPVTFAGKTTQGLRVIADDTQDDIVF